MRFTVLISLFIFATGAAEAAAPSPLNDSSLGGGNRYDRCLELTKVNAQEALSSAIGWQNTGGGAAAQHCAVIALVELKRYPEAASRLDQMGHAAVGVRRNAPPYSIRLVTPGCLPVVAERPSTRFPPLLPCRRVIRIFWRIAAAPPPNCMIGERLI
jgi:hypothetical protein